MQYFFISQQQEANSNGNNNSMASQIFQKYLATGQSRSKHKKQCLKQKNILFENDQLQLGCKILPLYDFYSSHNYLLLNLFIGNKTDRTIEGFRLDFRGTSNLDLFVQEKHRSIKERTQYKERIVIGCTHYDQDILLLMDFQCPLVTLRSTPMPLSLYNFCIFSRGDPLPPTIQTQTDLQQFLQHKYQYIQEQELEATSPIFKKALHLQFQKYFSQLSKICEGVMMGSFTTLTLLDEYVLVLKLVGERRVKICLGSNQYNLFQQLFGNFKYLLE